MAEQAILFDSSKCIACRACQVACKQWWELPGTATLNAGTYENPPELQPQTWNKIMFKEITDSNAVRWLFTRKACMHCTSAVCVWVCPTFARTYSSKGYVAIDPNRCIGCGRCGNYCPFAVPRLGNHDVSARITVEEGSPKLVSYKCAFCKDRVEEGIIPACVKTCPTGTLQFGLRADLIVTAKSRINAIKLTYPKANLYGEYEMSGLHVLYILTDEPATHGFPVNPQTRKYPAFEKSSFPDWYIWALRDKKFPAVPPEAKPEWYMQPGLVPEPRKAELSWPATATGANLGWGSSALLGWLGLGVVGIGTALVWTFRRKKTQQSDNPKMQGDKSENEK